MIKIKRDSNYKQLTLLCSLGSGIKIDITEKALLKMAGLIEAFGGEVGWHGTVNQTAKKAFSIDDILIYPQDATAASIDTEQQVYSMWLYGQEDDIFRRIRMHGHSHANFTVTPSCKDDRHRMGLTAQIKPGMFYLFMIWNKQYKLHNYAHIGSDAPLEPENIKVFITLDGKRMPFKRLPVKKLKRLLNCAMVNDFVTEARKIVNEGRAAS